ncbi:MAG: DUF1566 domain-containing protein [Gammaproteobacteria bacterium]|nr:DUF1566 domain-containing protein [Gammaproteobacteria bacterium]
MEAAPEDQWANAGWGCVGRDITGADGTAVGTGAQNTADILAGCAEAGIAARVADAYTFNGFDDWFLPSKNELYELWLNRDVVGIASAVEYWSSTEANATERGNPRDNAWVLPFNFIIDPYYQGGVHYEGNKSNNGTKVRAVREF